MARFCFSEFDTLNTTLQVTDLAPKESASSFRAGLDAFFDGVRVDDKDAGPSIVTKIHCPEPIPQWASNILREQMPQCYQR